MKNFKDDVYCSDLELKMNELKTKFESSPDQYDIDTKFNEFLNCLTLVTNKHAPLVKISKNELKMQHKP